MYVVVYLMCVMITVAGIKVLKKERKEKRKSVEDEGITPSGLCVGWMQKEFLIKEKYASA